jgi:PAS domain S-box-containing protein
MEKGYEKTSYEQNEMKYSFSDILEDISDGVFIIDRNYRYVYVNNSGCSMSGFSREEILGESLFDVNHPEDWDEVARFAKEVESKGKAACEVRIRRKGGQFAFVEAVARVRDNGYIQCVVKDISSRKKAERVLEEKEQIFERLAETVSAGIKVVQDGKVIYANSKIEEMTGYTREEFMSIGMEKLVHPDHIPVLMEKRRQLFTEASGKNKHEVKMVKKNGEVCWVETQDSVISINGRDAVLVCFYDITDYKNMQKHLKENEERYRLLLELLPDAVYVRREEKLIYANGAAARIFGFNSPEQVTGRSLYELVYSHPEYKGMAVRCMNEIKKSGSCTNSRLKIIRTIDRREIDVELSARKVLYGGEKATIVVVKDITEEIKARELQKEIEKNSKLLNEALEYDKLKTEFFANLSHELRTPLNVILGIIQLQEFVYKDVNDNEYVVKSKKYINILKQNCYRLLRLVNNLLDITKIDSGYFTLNRKNKNIVGIVEDITMSVVDYVKAKGINLIFDTDVEEKIIAVDPDKIERIMMNLLSNAVKFTPVGGNLEVYIFDKGEVVVISVKDSGMGIPEDKQSFIFNRFIQVDKSLSRQNEGSGIGLSLVKSLVEMHGGSISVRSEEGAGSEFIIELPCDIIEEVETTEKDNCINHSKIERVNIEFSDIYR